MEKKWQHIVQYYETDKMGITHHSNYIRWMEEARISFLDQIGFPYAKIEEMGIISPVLSAEAKYKKTSTFSDIIDIDVTVEEFKGVKLFLAYKMTNQNGEVVCLGTTSHCFLDMDGRPIAMDKRYPEIYEKIVSQNE